MNKIKKPKAILLKIFGVTTSRQFEITLDKYFESQLTNYLKARWDEENLVKFINKLRNDAKEAKIDNPSVPLIEENDKSIELIIKSITSYVDWVSKNNVKQSSIHELKSFVWGEGFNKKDLKSPFFEDVPIAFKEWKSQNIKIYTFSSGSVEGQSTYLTCSNFGDLSSFVSGFICAKKPEMDKYESICYLKVSEIINEKRDDILFLTDNIKEAHACLESGLLTILVSRDNCTFNVEEAQYFQIIQSFSELKFN